MRTQTLGAHDPVVTIVPGHHDAKTFNAFFSSDEYRKHGRKYWTEEDLSHEYWVKNADGTWSPSVKTDAKAQAVTVGDW